MQRYKQFSEPPNFLRQPLKIAFARFRDVHCANRCFVRENDAVHHDRARNSKMPNAARTCRKAWPKTNIAHSCVEFWEVALTQIGRSTLCQPNICFEITVRFAIEKTYAAAWPDGRTRCKTQITNCQQTPSRKKKPGFNISTRKKRLFAANQSIIMLKIA